MRKAAYIFLTFILSSCGVSGEALNTTMKEDFMRPINMWEPKPYGIGEVPKGGSPEFTQGWEDGCHSGLAAYGGDHYHYLGYKFRQDVRMITNKEYYQAWQDSYLYCRWYIWNYVRPLSGTPGWIF